MFFKSGRVSVKISLPILFLSVAMPSRGATASSDLEALDAFVLMDQELENTQAVAATEVKIDIPTISEEKPADASRIRLNRSKDSAAADGVLTGDTITCAPLSPANYVKLIINNSLSSNEERFEFSSDSILKDKGLYKSFKSKTLKKGDKIKCEEFSIKISSESGKPTEALEGSSEEVVKNSPTEVRPYRGTLFISEKLEGSVVATVRLFDRDNDEILVDCKSCAPHINLLLKDSTGSERSIHVMLSKLPLSERNVEATIGDGESSQKIRFTLVPEMRRAAPKLIVSSDAITSHPGSVAKSPEIRVENTHYDAALRVEEASSNCPSERVSFNRINVSESVQTFAIDWTPSTGILKKGEERKSCYFLIRAEDTYGNESLMAKVNYQIENRPVIVKSAKMVAVGSNKIDLERKFARDNQMPVRDPLSDGFREGDSLRCESEIIDLDKDLSTPEGATQVKWFVNSKDVQTGNEFKVSQLFPGDTIFCQVFVYDGRSSKSQMNSPAVEYRKFDGYMASPKTELKSLKWVGSSQDTEPQKLYQPYKERSDTEVEVMECAKSALFVEGDVKSIWIDDRGNFIKEGENLDFKELLGFVSNLPQEIIENYKRTLDFGNHIELATMVPVRCMTYLSKNSSLFFNPEPTFTMKRIGSGQYNKADATANPLSRKEAFSSGVSAAQAFGPRVPNGTVKIMVSEGGSSLSKEASKKTLSLQKGDSLDCLSETKVSSKASGKYLVVNGKDMDTPVSFSELSRLPKGTTLHCKAKIDSTYSEKSILVTSETVFLQLPWHELSPID